MEHVERLIGLLFQPPPIPPLSLPLAARLMPGLVDHIRETYTHVYFVGFLQGFVFGGMLVALFLLPRRAYDKGTRDATT